MAEKQTTCRIYVWHDFLCVSGEMSIEEDKEEDEEEEA